MSDNATRLAAHPRWEWQVGMVAADYGVVSCLGLRTVIGGRDVVPPKRVVYFSGAEMDDTLLARAVPDIQHPATQGWLIRWLAESGRLGGLRHDGVSVYVIDDEGHMVPVRFDGNEALAAALLAAWGSDERDTEGTDAAGAIPRGQGNLQKPGPARPGGEALREHERSPQPRGGRGARGGAAIRA